MKRVSDGKQKSYNRASYLDIAKKDDYTKVTVVTNCRFCNFAQAIEYFQSAIIAVKLKRYSKSSSLFG